MKVKDWDLIETAIELHLAKKDSTALVLLKEALDFSDEVGCAKNCCSNQAETEAKNNVESEAKNNVESEAKNNVESEAKNYGLNNYSDADDPRDAQTARSHIADKSVHLIVHTKPERKYKLHSVRSVGDADGNGGRHVAKVRVPSSFSGQVVLATGYNGNPDKFDDQIPHSVGQEVVIDGKFKLPALGPLAIFLKENGKIVSDVVGNIGLPDGLHFSFNLDFSER